MNMPRALLAAALVVSFSATAGPRQPQPQFSQASRDAFLARTPPLVGELVVAPALPAKKTSRANSRAAAAKKQRAKRNSSTSSGDAAEAAMKRENCQLMKQMYRSQVRDGGVVAVDSSGKEFILRGPRADVAIARAKRDVARWCN